MDPSSSLGFDTWYKNTLLTFPPLQLCWSLALSPPPPWPGEE